MFDVLEEKDMRSSSDKPDITELPAELRTAEDFTVAGFRVRVSDLEGDGDVEQHIWVEEKTSSAWLQLGNSQISEAVARWWVGLGPENNDEELVLKSAGDETLVDLFRKICVRVKDFFQDALRNDSICLDALQSWLEEELGEELLGFERGENLR